MTVLFSIGLLFAVVGAISLMNVHIAPDIDSAIKTSVCVMLLGILLMVLVEIINYIG